MPSSLGWQALDVEQLGAAQFDNRTNTEGGKAHNQFFSDFSVPMFLSKDGVRKIGTEK